jgi:NAD(P)-dependent dehydrogenase (short-subunit alcohol dehydrogenase family)
VNAICPGLIRTPLTEGYFSEAFTRGLPDVIPLGHAGEPRHIGDAAVFLASERAAYITGIALPVDGGFLADKLFAPPGSDSAYHVESR